MNAAEHDLPWRLVLASLPVSDWVRKELILSHGCARAVLEAGDAELRSVERMTAEYFAAIRGFSAERDLREAEKAIAFMRREEVRPVFLTDPAYPCRLMECPDPPAILFVKGRADLGAMRMLGIVGTRKASFYGRDLTRDIVGGIAHTGVIIVSGLAYGIDAAAHRAALEHGPATVGVMANSIDTVYPIHHQRLAAEMLQAGGSLVSETLQGTSLRGFLFPKRNRIVAGLCQAILVIESAEKGGSMITARLALDYNRDVLAVPGRSIDLNSGGCNKLIRESRAALVTSAGDVLETLRWEKKSAGKPEARSPRDSEQAFVLDIIRTGGLVTVDSLTSFLSGRIEPGKLPLLLLQLEIGGFIKSLPGSHYRTI